MDARIFASLLCKILHRETGRRIHYLKPTRRSRREWIRLPACREPFYICAGKCVYRPRRTAGTQGTVLAQIRRRARG